jgi:hypothetical protein
MAKVDYKLDTFTYFSSFCPDLGSRKVLDYGSNFSTFLDSSNGSFDQSQYTGVDVDQEALIEAKALFSDAKFIHYNGYNIAYNPTGQTSLRPNLTDSYDAIISYSVLVHTTIDDHFDTIDYLYGLLNPNGKLMISFLDVDDGRTKEFFSYRRRQSFETCDTIIADDWTYLIDNKIDKAERESNLFLLFFKKTYLEQRLAAYNFQLMPCPDKHPTCFQSCIVITKP